ncbi:MAG: phosphodiesterase [Gammaproteobacteria bacterium]|nr:phosphodiesterase [Gammaproteobacteria bacterium]
MTTIRCKQTLKALSGGALLLGCGLVFADTLNMPTPETAQNVPQRGVYMDDVVAQFGEPVDKKPVVGEPPISRWVYENFRVYFENDQVIHSVSR